tara:strand:- start:230 stop:1438 length:1209 start_codon:yes stop_codon:yes gene_type:complete
MANVTHLKHLEHLEDEMLNYGVDGCKSIVSFLQELRKMLGCDNSTGFMQTKWDGIPSIVCGIDPQIGQFFIANKSAFNKEIPKVAFTPKAVDKYYGHAPDLADRLKLCLKHLKKLDIKGVVQGDFIATRGDIKTETVHGERLYTFGNQALTYAIPVDHPIGRTIIEAEIIVVLHTHYTGSSIQTMQARAGLGEKIKTVKEVAVIDNDTPMHKIGLDHNEEVKFDKMVSNIDSNCKICGEFLDELVLLKGTKGDAKWHVSSYLKQFFNDQIKRQKTISNPAQALEDLTNFYHSKVKPAADKLKTPAAQVQKKTLIYDSENYLINNSDKFKAMLQLYKDIQQLKQFVINKLDHLETFKTFVRTENGYKVTGPEGYVLHKDGDMVKLVNRLEFSYINFTLAKQWR